MAFKLGDNVVVNGNCDGEYFDDEMGFIIAFEGKNILVAFNIWNHGHQAQWADVPYDLKGYQKSKNCWFVDENMLTLLESSDRIESKYSKVISKIKNMEKRRANLGYKTYQL